MVKHAVAFVCAAVVLCLLAGQGLAAGAGLPENIGKTVEERIRPVMEEYGIPGMAVGVTAGGESRVFLFGVASKKDDRKVTADTLFEIGSVSKTFTGLLTAYAEQQRLLSLEDKASRHWPALKGSSFDAISIIELGTYTAGGLPLQFPDSVGNDEQMLAYFTKWRPEYSPGSKRLDSNPSLGLMGRLTALSMGSPFAEIMEKSIFPKLGLKSTYIQVPANRMADYAWGYSKDDKPVRVTPGVLDAEP